MTEKTPPTTRDLIEWLARDPKKVMDIVRATLQRCEQNEVARKCPETDE